MADVFVSYSRQDSPFVTRLTSAIESSGKQVWIDTTGIEDTEVFPLKIRSAIESSDAFLFVISPASVTSRFCEQEVDYALSLNKRLVPVLLAHVPDDELPEAIRDRSWIPFEVATEFDDSLTRVLTALDTDLEHRRSHTRWLTKAIEWDKARRDKSLLLRGSELRSAEGWLAGTTDESDPAPMSLQSEYVLASRQAAARRSRMVVSSSLAVAVVSVGLLVFALISRGQAIHAQVVTSAQALADESQNDLTVDPEASVILATRAVDEQATPQTMLALREALDASPLRASLPSVTDTFDLCNGPGPSVAFRPGTHEIAENACGEGIRIADARTGKLISRLSSIGSGTYLSYNPTGSVLAVGTLFGVSLLDPSSGAVEKVLLLPTPNGFNTPGPLAFNPNGTTIGVIGYGGPTALFNVRSGREIQLSGTNQNNDAYAANDTSLAFTSGGRFVVAGTSLGVTPVFDLEGRLVRTLQTGPPSLIGYPSYVAASPIPNGPLAVAVNTDAGNGSVEIWNTRTWKMEFVLTTSTDVQFSDLAFSPDGTRLAVAEANGSAAVWSIDTRREVVTLLGQTAEVNTIVFSPKGDEVATASDDGTVRVWQASGPELDDIYLEGSIKSAALSATNVVVASLDRSRIEVSEWRTSGGEVRRFLIPGSSLYDAVSVSRNGEYVAEFANRSPTGNMPCPSGQLCPSGLVQVYDVATGQICAGCSYPVAGAEAVAWNQDGRELAVASNALEIVPLAATGHAIALSVPGAEQCGLDGAPEFSENDALVAWATRCGNVAVFTVEGKAVASFTAQGQPSAVAFNPAGTALAVSSWSGAVGIWNVRTGRRMFSLPNAPSGVSSIAYSRDGRYIVTTLLNDSAQVWDATSGQLARVDESSAPTLIAPVFDDEGDFATGDSTGTIKIWAECPDCEDARLLVGLAHRRVVSQLTPLERAAEG